MFDWYYGVIIVLFTINVQQHRQRILIYKGLTFTRVSLRALKDNIRYGGTSCHCFQATNRNWLKIRFPQSLPRRPSTEWEEYWKRDCVREWNVRFRNVSSRIPYLSITQTSIFQFVYANIMIKLRKEKISAHAIFFVMLYQKIIIRKLSSSKL